MLMHVLKATGTGVAELSTVMRKRLLILAAAMLPACERGNSADPALSGPTPAAAMVRLNGGLALDEALALIESELDLTLKGEGNARARIERAEAVTDRLVETQLPFAWISSRSYGVEPMLRQIQVLADRIVAQQRNGKHPDAIRRDVIDLLELVRGLRAGLREGGGPHPPSLDSLLARYAADTLAKAGPGGGE
jgi:hypothetical protein